MKNRFRALVNSALVMAGVCCCQNQQPRTNVDNTSVNTVNAATAPTACDASADWVKNPQNAPSEVPLGSNAKICQFHQFSWQWFLALMSTAGDSRVFQNEQNFPLLQAQGVNSCTASGVKSRIFVRTRKDDDDRNNEFVLPERIGQAGGNATIYDQNGNAVFYEVRFSRDQCSLDQNTAKMFPAGTTEIKVSYRVITAADKPNYVWINADINGDGTLAADELLGMVGFHLVKSTPLHPEFIWATFEHKQNVPECQWPPDPNAKAWSFTSTQCASELPNPAQSSPCNFNSAVPGKVILGGPPSQICRVYHDGTKIGDNQYDTNISAIDALNLQLTGPTGFITALPGSNPLAVLKNYILVGALWENDVTQPSSALTNQRGSIQLANSTMETRFQQAPNFNPAPYTGTGNLKIATNCFDCHSYTPGNNVLLSHIFTGIQGSAKKN